MAKSIMAICVLLSIAFTVKAQQLVNSPYPGNPFTGVQFGNSYKDTVTLRATYLGETGEAGQRNLLTLSQIGKLHGLNTGKFQNAIAFSVAGFAQRFYMPYRAGNQQVIASAKPNSMLQLKCIVYRFFTVDGICNFFYVDKVTL